LQEYKNSNVGGTQLALSQVKFEKQVQKTSFPPFPAIFEDDFDRVRSKIEAQSELRPVWYMTNKLASCFGVTRSITGKSTTTQQNLARRNKKIVPKKKNDFFWIDIPDLLTSNILLTKEQKAKRAAKIKRRINE
jgi:hypothetical protein